MTAPVVSRPAQRSASARVAPAAKAIPLERARRDHLRVVEEARRRRLPRLIGAVAVLLVLGTLFANAVFHSFLVADQARLDSLNQQVTSASIANQRDQLRVANLEAPQRIVSAAQRAGLRLPATVHWISLSGAGSPSSSTVTHTTSPPASTSSNSSDLAAGQTSTATSTVPAGQ